jgi:PAS domain S-box-containing protein
MPMQVLVLNGGRDDDAWARLVAAEAGHAGAEAFASTTVGVDQQVDILVVSPSFAEPLAAARVFQRQRPSGQIIFILPAERRDRMHRMLPFSPEISEAWILDENTPPAELRRLFHEASDVVERRRAIKGLFGRINAQIGGVSKPVSKEASRPEPHLALTQRYLTAILANAPDALVATSLNGFIFGWSDAAGRLFGKSWDDVTGQAFSQLFIPEDQDQAAALLVQVVAGESVRACELRLAGVGGAHRMIEVAANPVLGENGAAEGVSLIARDITDRKQDEVRLRELNNTLEQRVAAEIAERSRAEEALRQSQKMEAVGQLTGGLAHDFNNLLAGISGSLELLSARLAQGRLGELERYVTAAQGAARRAAALTHRLLAFSRRQTLDPKPTDMNRLVLGMEELVRRTVGPAITIEVVTAGGLWPTLVDPSQLENALLNLCINARDALPDGGRITIETANKWLDERAAKERDLPPGQYVSLCVSDTGTGMPPEVIARVFDPFFTTKPIGQGTGLGLSMIYGFARQSGGQIRIYSELGQGTTMCLYLPRHYGEAEHAAMDEAQSAVPHAKPGETVLVVDDEPTVRMLVSEVLEDLGYIAIEAADGAAGLKVLQSDVRIDLLVTDVGLPGGMNGRQVADGARAVRPGLKVLFITGYAENAVLSHGHLEPGMHVLTKPFTIDALTSRIRELITGKAGTA